MLTPLLIAAALSTAAEPESFDVVIYGGTSAGVAAAVQAKRMSRSVVLLEPSAHLGGLTTGGLGATDIGNKAAVGGVSREFYERVAKHYTDPAAWDWEDAADYRSPRGDAVELGEESPGAMWTFEPHVAGEVYAAMLKEVGIEPRMGRMLDRENGVERDGTRISAVAMTNGERYTGCVFLDCTYEGDLMAAAGVSYTVGREANATYGETINGVQPALNVKKHRFLVPVSPYLTADDPAGGLLPGIRESLPPDGTGDDGVQAYCYRLCATDVPENRVPWPKPVRYREADYELLFRNFEAGDHRLPWNPVMMPNRKTDANNNCAVSTDWIGFNHAYPEADDGTRSSILESHRDYQQGLMWSLADHPRVPAAVRTYYNTWGLAKDEFAATDHWPPQLYIREARRMVSDYVMTEHDVRGDRVPEDAVGLGAYGMDSHNVWRFVTPERTVQNEGDVQVGGFGPYPISYRSVVPRRAECTNLLVPVCLSASHIAYGSIRMEPVFMVLGQSAATAASLAIGRDAAVQDVPYEALRTRLSADGQVLAWDGPRPRRVRTLPVATLPGVVADDGDARFAGDWRVSASVGPLVGPGYRVARRSEGEPVPTATFTLTAPAAGRYAVRIAYSPHPNRDPAASVTVATANRPAGDPHHDRPAGRAGRRAVPQHRHARPLRRRRGAGHIGGRPPTRTTSSRTPSNCSRSTSNLPEPTLQRRTDDAVVERV